MTNREVVKELTKKGYKVKFTKRTDGSIRVTRIESKRGKLIFKPASKATNPSAGNNAARNLLNKVSKSYKAEHDFAKEFQRKEALKVIEKIRAKNKRGLQKLTEEERKAIRKAQRQARKIGKKGHISTKQYREIKKREGAAAAGKALKNTLQHLQGYSYAAQVQALIDYLETSFSGEYGVSTIVRRLTPFANGNGLLRDEILKAIYQIYYQVGKTLTGKQAYEQAKTLLDQN